MRQLGLVSEKLRPSLGVALVVLAGVALVWAQTSSPAAGGSAVTRAVGTIKSVGADGLTITSDSGAEVAATLAPSTKILRVPPGEKDLKNATPLQPQDLQPGDRVLVRGQESADGRTIAALSVIVMKQADVSAKQEREREDWQKRGLGGLVSAVDAASGTITISTSGSGGSHNIAVHTTKSTIARRYAPGSVKFDDARPAPLDQIRVGDQLRARGARSADGNEIAAEEIVSGTFRNIAGTITAIDAASNSITVQDAIAKASVVVKFLPDSQIKRLPAEMAQRIAMRLKYANGEGGVPGAAGQGPANSGGSRPAAGAQGADGQSPRWPGAGQGGGNGPTDLQRFLGRLPSSQLSDLPKGEAVMIVSTADGDGASVTAITLLAGVEPILTASPNRNAATMLSPWTLGASGGEGEGAQQ
jgi:hypothetical protein